MSGLDELTREELIEPVQRPQAKVQARDAEIGELKSTRQRQAERIAELGQEAARLRGGGSSVMLSIKPSVRREERGPRGKPKHSFARRALAPTEVVSGAVQRCSDCGGPLTGGSVKWRHQVADIPRVVEKVRDPCS